MDSKRRRRSQLKTQPTKDEPSVESSRPSGTKKSEDANSYNENSIFRRYWTTANAAQLWLRRHRQYSQQGIALSAAFLYPHPPFLTRQKEKVVRSAASSFESSFAPNQEANGLECVAEPVEHEDDSKMDLSDDVLAFMKHTIRHRIEREKKKAEDQAIQDATVVFVPADRPFARSTFNEFGGDASAVADMLQGSNGEMTAAERRRQEMIRLYGFEAAGRIQAEETLLQMKFDQEYDKHHPPFWPNIPLKL